MDKNMVISFVLFAFIIGFFSANYFGGTTDLVKEVSNSSVSDEDIEFYKHISGYMYLLNEEDYELSKKTMETLNEDEDIQNKMILIAMRVILEDQPELKDKIDTLIEDIKSKKTDISYFEQNTSCASLESVVKSGLNPSKESLEFIFYSPNQDSCLYVTSSVISYSLPNDSVYKRVYKTGSNSLLNSYEVYNTDQYNDPARQKKSDIGSRNFVKYILENSNYNIELLDGSSYIYI